MKHKIHYSNKGQTLVTLLVFTVVAIAVTSTAVAITVNITRATTMVESRIIASQAAESGIENAIIRILRDPDYAGESLQIGDTIVDTSVAGTDPVVITAVATYGSYVQTLQVTITNSDNQLTVSDWTHLY